MLHRYRWAAAALVILIVGFVLKGMAVPTGQTNLTPEARVGRFTWPWGAKAVVTPYFPAAQGQYLIPVARQVKAASPETALAELFAGPAPGRGLDPAIPPGASLVSVDVQGDDAVVTVEGGPLPETTLRAMAATLGVTRLQEQGGAAVELAQKGTKLYYLHQGMPLPVVLPGEHLQPREAVERLLAGGAPEGVSWVPPGVSLDAFEQKGKTARVRLAFTPELQTLVEKGIWNFAPYYMGLVYTLTEFPDIDRVYFEFAGLSPLALSQCQTPLSVPLERLKPEAGRAGR